MSLHFTSNATFDIGTDLDSPVSLDYFDQAPFAFNGTIGTTTIVYLKKVTMATRGDVRTETMAASRTRGA